jgi:hypothetical protein
VTKHRITIKLFHCIDGSTGRVASKRHAGLHWHDRAAFDFLHQSVRGYRGSSHPLIPERYAKKVQALATAAGFSVAVEEKPKPTPAEGKAIHRRAIAYMAFPGPRSIARRRIMADPRGIWNGRRLPRARALPPPATTGRKM